MRIFDALVLASTFYCVNAIAITLKTDVSKAKCPTSIVSTQQYKKAYLEGCPPVESFAEGFSDEDCPLHGRVISKGPHEQWDSRLSGNHSYRNVVWAVGSDALAQYTEQHLNNPLQMLTELGWHSTVIKLMIQQGFEFQLVVWGGVNHDTGNCDKAVELNRRTVPAAWPNAWQKVRKVFQEVGIELPFITDQVLKRLHTTSFEALTGGGCHKSDNQWTCGAAEATRAFNEIPDGKAGLEYFLVLHRPSALQVRSFLMKVLQFDVLYTGLGYTQSTAQALEHRYGWAEFLLRDAEIESLPFAHRLPIHFAKE
eukprot:CFRG1110T1